MKSDQIVTQDMINLHLQIVAAVARGDARTANEITSQIQDGAKFEVQVPRKWLSGQGMEVSA